MISSLITKIRNLINDNSLSTSYSDIYTISSIFTLPKTLLSVTSVTINGAATVSYTTNVTANTVTITASLSANDVITIYYTYQLYSDTVLKRYIRNALGWLNIYKYYYELEGDEIYPLPSLPFQNLICMIVWILIEPEYSEYRLSHITVRYPKKYTKEEKIRQLIQDFKMGSSYTDTISFNFGVE